MNEWSLVAESSITSISREQFWQATWLWIHKPHVINKRLFDCEITHYFENELFNDGDPPHEQISFVFTSSRTIDECVINLKSMLRCRECAESEAHQFSNKKYIVVKKLFLKSDHRENLIEICCIDYETDQILQFQKCNSSQNTHPSILPSIIKLHQNRINILILRDSVKSIFCEWLRHVLLPKLTKWAQNAESKNIFQINEDSASLRLVSADVYNELYSLWKQKYGKPLVENWTESTDPLKFVYEDVAIAAYLCLLWGSNKVKFVDMGCGNGLLVYILSQEGHKGLGIDIRPRKIWSFYPQSTELQVGAITPKDNCHHPQADWIIGNHSDELTPWIPIFTALNSYRCKFFLLPCCAFELNGRRYQRRNASVSVYNDYIEYVKNLCTQLGFEFSTDKLRIPSTKRTCLIARGRIYDSAYYEEKLSTLLKAVIPSQKCNFIPRSSIEEVRNCTKIDKSVTSRIYDAISATLIRRQMARNTSDENVWSDDYSISFKEAVNLIETEDLKNLKKEYGGLQTLLRNNHSVYLIRDGRILFRKPSETTKRAKWKNRPCWFYHNHPLRCPLQENKCSFIH